MEKGKVVIAMRTREYPYPIYVAWTSGVEDWEAIQIIEGVKKMLEAAKYEARFVIFGSSPWTEDEDYASVDWYQSRSIIGNQIDTERMDILLAQEPWRKTDHLDLMIVDQDIEARRVGCSFCLAYTSNKNWIVFSVYRFRGISSYEKGLKTVAAHEFGHILGLVDPLRVTADRRGGHHAGHCANELCVMNQVESGVHAVKLGKELEKNHRFLCHDCTRELFGIKEIRPLPKSTKPPVKVRPKIRVYPSKKKLIIVTPRRRDPIVVRPQKK